MMKMSAVMGMVAAAGLLVGCGDKDGDSASARVDDILALTGDSGSGASVYSGNCAACHGADGEGGTGPAMSDAASGSDEEIVETVLNGEGSMPSFSSLEDQEIADLLAYINATF